MYRVQRHAVIASTLLAAFALTAFLTPTPAKATDCYFLANATLFSVSGSSYPDTISWGVVSWPSGLQVDVWGSDQPFGSSPTYFALYDVGTTQYTPEPYTFSSGDIGNHTRFAKVAAGTANECTTATYYSTVFS